MSVKGKTIIITGASRGVGRAIALKCAADGANIVLAAKSVAEGKLPGTIHSVAEEVRAAGGQALPLQVDVRFEDQVCAMVEATVSKFGGIDVLINNAGAIWLKPLIETPPKKMDLVMGVNVRATLLCTQAALPYLQKAGGAHVLNLSPPLSYDPKWLNGHVTYTISKYGMSLATLGLAEELKEYKIAVNSLWPRTAIATAAVNWMLGDAGMQQSRTPAIMADAAYEILNGDSTVTGNLFIDETLLREKGVTDFKHYSVDPTQELMLDLYVEE